MSKKAKVFLQRSRVILEPVIFMDNENTFSVHDNGLEVTLTRNKQEETFSLNQQSYNRLCLNLGLKQDEIPKFNFGTDKHTPGSFNIKEKRIKLCLGDGVDQNFFFIDDKTLYQCSNLACDYANRHLIYLLSSYYLSYKYSKNYLKLENIVLRYLPTLIHLSLAILSCVIVGYYIDNIVATLMFVILQMSIVAVFYKHQQSLGKSLSDKFSKQNNIPVKLFKLANSQPSIIALD